VSNDGPHGNKGLTADHVIHILDLAPHPEGGHFRETFRDTAEAGQRAASSAICFLLKAGEQSHWHSVDAAEAWLGPRLDHGERPQAFVPKGHWQRARSLGAWTLVGCTVAPAFTFDGFTLAAPDFSPDLPSRRG
jgi:uncharacterized protein